MKIKIMENDSMKGEGIKVPKTVKQAIELTGFSRKKVERLIREHKEWPVQNGNYWFILKEE
jgi:hypothetical protein